MPRAIVLWGMLAILAGNALGRAEDSAPSGRGVGQRVGDFTLNDVLTGEDVALADFEGKRACVLIFTGTNCPIGELYWPRLVELAKQYGPRDVAFLAINANQSESAEAVAAHARPFGVSFPVLKDPGRAVADRLQAQRTCEALVLDAGRVLRYRGAIDDQYGLGTRRAAPTKRFLADALEAVLAGRAVETPATEVVGCPIESPLAETTGSRLSKLPRIRPPTEEQIRLREEQEGPLPEVGPVTYAGEVAAILQEKCEGCHRRGQAAPFALRTYEDAKRWAVSIFEVVDDRRMPPWHADPRYGRFANDRRLTPKERATLLAWVEQGTPPGDLAQAPPPRSYPEGWTIGTPDVVFEIPEPYTVKADGFLDYQYFKVPTHFAEDVWVQAAETRPGDRSVVHHIVVFANDPKDPDHSSRICMYDAGGDQPTRYTPGIAKRIPAGATLEFEIHYQPAGRIKIDRTAVGLIFAKGPVRREARTLMIADREFAIPPGADNHEVVASEPLEGDTLVLNFTPHMHLRGKDFLYRAIFPDGRKETLLSVPAYDFGWQSQYMLAEPRRLPAGTRIECVAHYDNTSRNPANPDPGATVTWGQQTHMEMMIGYVDITDAEATSNDRPRPAAPSRALDAGPP